ncbi:MAG: sigma-54-dependent Fis family transcriptional regulator [Candidatus Omnitrophica bacterium]|nr:sigma-54-dependent Fis family transcriptional regulator [Candidatus Omnitrophota bacterium]MCB9781661.1 sigma-54-dependent Fis family transcriptional regulator [Candidatus Omnitrophota bacterium]
MVASILVVDDEKNAREGLAQALDGSFGKDAINVETAEDGMAAMRRLSEKAFDLMIADIKMPNLDGMELLKRSREKQPTLEVLMLTGHGTIEMAVEAMRLGAKDYLQKPVNLDELELVVRRILDQQKLLSENEYLRTKLREKNGYQELIGSSPAMKKLFEKIEQVAVTKATVLITGESGTGKELVAEAIHHLSPRKDQPLVKVNCSALNENLLESELFGHERGAFTGAIRQRKGRFELADKGTIFLDEIGELSLDVQVKLLRILEEKEFERVGGNQTIRVDTRLIFATNADLEEKVKEGAFREDFYFRLKVVTLHNPPLRERKEDVRPLAEYFVRQFSLENGKKPMEIEESAIEVMKNYDWPGNVRELRNLIEHMVLLRDDSPITATDLRDYLNVASPSEGVSLPMGVPLADVEKEYILKTLEAHEGNRTRAAESLGIGRRTLIRKLADYGLGST